VLAWRDITNATNERTLIASVLPSVAVPHTARILIVDERHLPLLPALVANFGSFALDYIARQKIGGTHMSGFIVDQLAVIAPDRFNSLHTWIPERLSDWLKVRVLELTYTAWDLEGFAREFGYAGAPFRWDPERRFILRCELDAAFFRLYGMSRADVDHVMETFTIVRRDDLKNHGEYRTKRLILAIYDALEKAAQSDKAYRTALDPPPGAPGASHGVFALDGTPKDYSEALVIGLLFALIRRSDGAGISQGALSRALLWLQDPSHAASWLESAALSEFERVRSCDALIEFGALGGQVPRLLDALENERAITRSTNGTVRLRAGGSIPNWLPQTPIVNKLARLMREGLERAERGSSTTVTEEQVDAQKAKRV
jgi:hypothetical protein